MPTITQKFLKVKTSKFLTANLKAKVKLEKKLITATGNEKISIKKKLSLLKKARDEVKVISETYTQQSVGAKIKRNIKKQEQQEETIKQSTLKALAKKKVIKKQIATQVKDELGENAGAKYLRKKNKNVSQLTTKEQKYFNTINKKWIKKRNEIKDEILNTLYEFDYEPQTYNYTLKSMGRKKNDTFKVENEHFQVRYNGSGEVSYNELASTFTDALYSFLSASRLVGTDIVKLGLKSEGGKYISTSWNAVSTFGIPLSKDNIEQNIMGMFSAGEEYEGFEVDGNLLLDITYIQSPQQALNTINTSGMAITKLTKKIGKMGTARKMICKEDIYKKKSVIKLHNQDDLCVGRCIVVALAKRDKHPKYQSIMKGGKIQTILAHKLYNDAGVDMEIADLDTIRQFEDYLDCSITIIDGDNFCNVVYPDVDDKEYIVKDFNIYLLKLGEHTHLIDQNRIAGFFAKSYYCNMCKKSLNNKEHKCNFKCKLCKKRDCDFLGQKKVKDWFSECDDCNKWFPTQKCFENHIDRCDLSWKCGECNKTYDTKRFDKDTHICGDYYCANCKSVVNADHKCYMMPKPLRPKSDKYIYYDLETTQDTNGGEHIVNLAVAMYDDSSEPIIFHDIDTFCKWLFDMKHKNYTIVAHNGRGFDNQFLLRYLYTKTTIKPFIIYNGSKIMLISIKELKMRMIDSLNFLTMRLSDMPKTFGINELKKGYFPHYFNTNDNANYVGEIPDRRFFGADSMKENDRKNFLEWWDNQRDSGMVYNLKDELISYCISDVDILRKCCKAFRNIYIDICDIDPFAYTTIASVCMAIYKAYYIVDNFMERFNELEEICCEGSDSKIIKDDFWKQIRDEVFTDKKIGVLDYEEQEFIRKSFFGGRTNAMKIRYNFKDNEEGRYADITSLYPTTNYYDEYPKGHPTKIYEKFDLTLKSYFGIVDCYVIPPKDLYHPVLAEKGEKLMFDLNDKRGVWTTLELNKAIEKGYKIKKIYEVWNWETQTTDLFKGYVSTFLKIKQESSGFPTWCLNENDKQRYIDDYHNRQGIKLDKNKIRKNKGMRAVAKLCLNSLWGKFGQRINQKQTEVISDKKRFDEIMFGGEYQKQDFYMIDENRMEINYEMKDEFVSLDFSTNIAIATFTTSNARLRLYSALEILDRQVLYFDTDSVVYKYCEDDNDKKMECGDLLGDWTDELEGSKMIGTFVGLAPKNYSYQTDDGEYHTKIKGFSMGWSATQKLNHSSMLDMTYHLEEENKKIKVEQFTININKKDKILKSNHYEKQYGFSYTKRVILPTDKDDNIDTLPFGYEV
tara:strand:- start:82 stop:3975 length:3894 start_codon:yes stop_codon:yes gene_type:complete